MLERAAGLGPKPALVDAATGDILTYGALVRRVRRTASGLVELGLRKGDVLAIHAGNSPEYAVALLSVAAAGGTATTTNPLLTVDELAFQLVDSNARFLVTTRGLLDRAADAAERSAVEEIFVFDGPAPGSTPFAMLETVGSDELEVQIDPGEDLAALPYSSGTTGLPKGVMLTHRNLVANLRQIEPAVRRHGDPAETIAIAVLPFFHIYGMVVVLSNTLRHGGTVVTLPRFELDGFLRALEEHRVSHAYVVPPIVLALARHPSVDEFDLSSVELILSGAAPLGADLQRECADRTGSLVIQGYGLTESSPVTHITPFSPDANRPGTVGPLAPSTECRIVDPVTGLDLEAGDNGEVLVRGPQVMRGYLGNASATATTIDADGWLHTGDIGFADADGYLTLVDRVKELIKVKGYQVAPAELEALLLTHPGVRDAAVVGCPDAEAGEVPVAYVVLVPGTSPDEVAAFTAAHAAPYKRIRRVEVVSEIPKTPSGKILRRILAERERARVAATAVPDTR